MRTKDEILESTHHNALNAAGPTEVALIHGLHTLEVLIDIRDILAADTQGRLAVLKDIVKQKGGD
jgi:hypothetical protein